MTNGPPSHQARLRVRYADTDAMGVVHHANYLAYFEAGRVELLRSVGISYRDLEQRGFLAPVVEVTCRYRAPAYFDDLLLVRTRLAEARPARFAFEYDIVREADETLVAQGRSLHACLDRTTLRPVRIPEDILQRLQAP